ncbi:MAG: hypothetical protein Q7T55_13975 [Solirubrobacteraceae bacterium]|nr:hypothetical protein [Solirubrobacteraceae bacterium]
MYYAVYALLVLFGLFLITPGGAKAAANMRHLRFRGQTRDSTPHKVRENRIAGAFIIVGATVVMLSYTF